MHISNDLNVNVAAGERREAVRAGRDDQTIKMLVVAAGGQTMPLHQGVIRPACMSHIKLQLDVVG